MLEAEAKKERQYQRAARSTASSVSGVWYHLRTTKAVCVALWRDLEALELTRPAPGVASTASPAGWLRNFYNEPPESQWQSVGRKAAIVELKRRARGPLREPGRGAARAPRDEAGAPREAPPGPGGARGVARESV